MTLDSETKAVELPEHHGDELRLWLRLLTCTTLIEGEVRSRLRERFDVTLPRFDLMAQLDKVPEGMTLSDVSKRMMVSNGNVTGLVERLVESGHLDRRTSDADRRVQVIRLTKAGRAEFRKMAAEHELWIADVFGDLTPKDVRELMRLLGQDQGVGAEIREGANGLRLAALVHPAQRRRRRLAELGAIGARHSAQMGKSKLECDVGDAFVRGGGGQSDIEMREPDVAQHLRDRRSEMPLEAELQRADTRACGFGQLRKVERLVRMRMEEFARPPERLRQRFGPAAKPVDRIAGAVALAVEQTSQQRLAHVGRCDRRKRPLRSEAFGEIDELQNLRLKRLAAWRREIDRGFELDRARRPARQRRGPLLQQAAIDQQNELGAIALPGHSRGNRRRQ